jgi:hypothetical protein
MLDDVFPLCTCQICNMAIARPLNNGLAIGLSIFSMSFYLKLQKRAPFYRAPTITFPAIPIGWNNNKNNLRE